MRRKWVLIALAAGLLAALIGGGTALAWGGTGHGGSWGWSWGRGDHDERRTAVAAKVAEILGTDEQETADAIVQAQREVREEAAGAALEDLAGRVAETLGTDAEATEEAIASVSKEMFTEALEEKLQDAIDDGRITEEQAQEYRDKAASYGGWRGFDRGHRNGPSDEFSERVAGELDVEADDAKDAIEQALSDIRKEGLEAKLQAAVDAGRITEDEAEEIRAKIESGDWKGLGKRGRHGKHGGKGHWGRSRGHHGKGHSDSDATATPGPASDGDSA